MKKLFKKFISMVLAATMVASLLPATIAEAKPIDYFHITNTSSSDATISFETRNMSSYYPDLRYKVESGEWKGDGDDNLFTGYPNTITLTPGQTVYFKNNSGKFTQGGTDHYITFKCNQTHTVGGDITTLISNVGGVTDLTSAGSYVFQELFAYDTLLTSAKDLVLPSTKLTERCYGYMFNGCEALTEAPALPATTLANHCYTSMFNGCKSLGSCPALPATTIAEQSYYRMFKGCTSITESPVLRATQIPELGYSEMFYGCTKLNKVTAFVTSKALNGTSRWLSGVAATGTFVKSKDMIPSNIDSSKLCPNDTGGIPSGWTTKDASAVVTNNTTEANAGTNNGYIAFDKTSIAAGDTVTVIAYPSEGYILGTVTAKKSDNDDPVAVSGNTFVVPTLDESVNVVVEATFIPDPNPLYTVTYKDKDGEAFSGTHVGSAPTEHRFGTSTDLVSATKPGYTFDGWFTDPTCSGAPITTLGANDFSADITLYAKWTANPVYTITYKDKDGAAFSGTHETGYPTNHTQGADTTLRSASKTGYDFGGWFTDPSCTGTALTTLGANDFSADITLYAKWTPILTHVSFEGNAVDCTFQNSVSQLYGEYFVLPSWTPERPNHKFIGWYTAPTGGTKITASTICRNISDATCYAHWQKYTVKSTLFVRAASTLNSKVIKLAWNEISGATKYVVYGNICNKGIKKFATVKGKTLTVKNIGATKIYSHKLYKFVVVAYTPSGKVTSKMIYTLAGTTYKNYSNVTAVGGGYKPNIEKGETTDVSAIYYTYKNMKHISKTYGAPIRFFSNCASVATIDANGVITGKNPGTAMIYVQDIGGAMMKFKITVTNTPG